MKRCKEQGVELAALNMLQNLYDKSKGAILMGKGELKWFECNNGVQQGAIISPWLYSVYMDELCNELRKENIGVELSKGIIIPALLYADDIVRLITNSLLKFCHTTLGKESFCHQ